MGVVEAVPGRRQLDLPPRSLVSVVPRIPRWWRAVAQSPTDLHRADIAVSYHKLLKWRVDGPACAVSAPRASHPGRPGGQVLPRPRRPDPAADPRPTPERGRTVGRGADPPPGPAPAQGVQPPGLSALVRLCHHPPPAPGHLLPTGRPAGRGHAGAGRWAAGRQRPPCRRLLPHPGGLTCSS